MHEDKGNKDELERMKRQYLDEKILDKIREGWGDGGFGLGLLLAGLIIYFTKNTTAENIIIVALIAFGLLNLLIGLKKLWDVDRR